MKVLLYFEASDLLAKSGIGKAREHQLQALSNQDVCITTDPHCEDYDILHINTYGINSIPMIKKAKKLNKKIIYHAHSTEEDFRNSFIGSNVLAPYVRKYLIYLYEHADAIITPTQYSKQLLLNYGITRPIYPISNGIDLDKFKPNVEKEVLFRTYFSLNPNDKVIICVGLFFERKGIKDFVALAKALPEYQFIWFGKTPLLSIPSDIRSIVQGDHPENVTFPGYIQGDILEGAYSGADLFLFPSYEETEGIVVLEAFASKQKVLIRDIPVYEDWIQDQVHAYKAKNYDEFLVAIPEIVEGVWPDLSEVGYKLAVERDISQIGKQLYQVYQSVLALN